MADTIQDWAIEAAQLRSTLHPGEVTDSPQEIHGQVLTAQSVVDRIEEFVGLLTMMKADTAEFVIAAQDELDAAMADVVNNPANRRNEYETAVEKNVKIKAATLNEQVKLRQAEKKDRDVGKVLEYMKTLHWGARGVLRTLELRVKLISMDSAFGG